MNRESAGRTTRYQEKYDAILDAASELINSHGAQGMTLADVAQHVGLNTTSVTYYFRRKELLAYACYERSIERFERFIAQSRTAPAREARVAAFIAANLDDLRAVREGRSSPYAILSEVRTLEDEPRREILLRYKQMFGKLRAMLGTDPDPIGHARLTAQAHVLLEVLYWLPMWIDRYDLLDFPRVQARMTDLMLHGIAAPGQGWNPAPMAFDAADADPAAKGAQENFLRAATELINERGYRGASVERIASQLNVTKGSFYHHLDAKDDLVLACFRRSFARIARSQYTAESGGGSVWQHLCSSIATLLEAQFSEARSLLRSTALQALPNRLRDAMVDESNRLARRYAGMMSDGIAESTVRPVDTLIAAQIVLSTVNSAYDMRWWAERLPKDNAVEIYASTIAFGLFSGA